MAAKHNRSPEKTPVKLTDTAGLISRQQLLPGGALSYQEQLDRAGAVNVHNNAVIEYVGSDYMRVRPVDPTRRHGR